MANPTSRPPTVICAAQYPDRQIFSDGICATKGLYVFLDYPASNNYVRPLLGDKKQPALPGYALFIWYQ